MPGATEVCPGDPPHMDVSTLTQHECRVRPCSRRPRPIATAFQPSPSTNAGCDLMGHSQSSRGQLFQPSPSTNAGCDTIPPPSVQNITLVSTLTQHECRVRLCLPSALQDYLRCFNPHPARMPGATRPYGRSDTNDQCVSTPTHH